MSLTSQGVRKALAAAGVGALAALAAAAPANAAQLTQTYQCTYPLIGQRALTVNIDAAIPATWEQNVPTPAFDITADAEADLGTYQGLDLIGANKISGQAKATSTVTAPNFTLPVQVPIAIPEVTKPAAPPLVFTGLTGQTPSLTFGQTGNVNITVDKLDLNIAAVRADGSAIVLPPVVPVDSDGDPNTFDVPCVLNPAGQPNTLQDITVTPPAGDTTPPSVPGEAFITSINDVTSTSVHLYWDPSTDDDSGVAGYEIEYIKDADPAQTVEVGNVTDYVLDGLTPSGVYEIRLRAKDNAGNVSAYGDSIVLELPDADQTDEPPTAPGNLTGTATGETSVDLDWDASTDDVLVVGYEVFQDGTLIQTINDPSQTSATVTGLSKATTYKFEVRAVDAPGLQRGPFSEVNVKTQGNFPPTAPTDLAGTPTLTTVALSWTAATDDVGVDHYDVFQDGVKVDTVSGTSKTITGLAKNTAYEFTVEAVDTDGASTASDPVTVTTLADQPPSKPADLAGTPDKTSVALSWTASTDDEGVTGYDVYVDGTKVDTVVGTSKTVTGLTQGTAYAFKVAAVDTEGQTTDSDEISVTTLVDTPPTKPTGLAGTPAKTSVALSWTASTDDDAVAGYDVYQDGTKVDTVVGTSKTVTGLTEGTAYAFKVVAVDSAGQESDASDEISVTTLVDTPPTKPTGLAGTPTPVSVALSWTASTDDDAVAGYDVYQDGTKVDTVTGTSKTVTGLSPNTAYAFKVQAVDSAGQTSAFSDEITVTTTDNSTVDYSYSLKGSSNLRNLSKGTVPLSGGIDASLELATGNYEADLTLNNTRARLQVLGVIPVTADVGFIQSGKTIGSLQSGVLTATARFKIQLPKVYLFGILPIAGSSSCQTKSSSIATMTSVGAFDPLQGGKLAGTYGISDLVGCGWLNDILSPLTKGGGNTIDIDLTPKA